ncbi:MAG TPA: hypothetical protein VM241_07870 [Candidatus Thermoplasmatota archaeon]|nr:hypothetical protein [Candidatus Thermoplasmatota archaeon]
MKTQSILLALLLTATAVTLAPAAAATKDLCGEPRSPTMEFVCTVRDAGADYVTYLEGVVLGPVNCLLNTAPNQWLTVCIVLT